MPSLPISLGLPLSETESMGEACRNLDKNARKETTFYRNLDNALADEAHPSVSTDHAVMFSNHSDGILMAKPISPAYERV